MALCVGLETVNPAVANAVAELLLLAVQNVLQKHRFYMLRILIENLQKKKFVSA